MMKKVLSLIALMAAAFTAQAQDGLTWWGNYADEGFAITGNNKVPGDYEAAMFVAGDGTLKGVSIEQIRIQTRLSTSSSKDVKFFIRTALDGENVVEVTPETVASSGYTTVTLPEAYTLPETGAYVGYSFTVTQWWNEYEGTPVVYAKKQVEKGFYLKQPGETEFTDKSASTGCLAAQIGFKAPAATMWWGNYTGTESTGVTGNYKLGNYQAAMFVAGDGALGGAEITAMRAQTRLYSNAKDFKFWIRETLDGENLAEAVVEKPSSSVTEAKFDKAVTIPETGCYVGYSFNLSNWYSDYDYTPIVYAKKVVEKGFYLMQPEETTFTDKSSTGCLAAQIEVSGSNMATDAVQVADDIDDMIALVGQPIVLNLNLTNQGSAGVQSIDFTYNLDGEAKEGHLDLDPAIDAMLGAKQTVAVELEAPTQAGLQEIELVITKVNGNDNGITGRKAKCSVNVTVISESAPRKAVAEIFYNATNGYAPRAIVGANLLNQEENVIAFLVDHYNGKQAVAPYADYQKIPNETSYTNKYNTYPVMEVNRAFTEDPYTGLTAASNYAANHFGAAEPVKATLGAATPASVSLTAVWSKEDPDSVVMNATVNFKADFKSAPFRLAFVVIKDNVKETISNYIMYYKSVYADEDMAEWLTNPYTNENYTLNNVAVAASDVTGIQKSLPTKNIVAGEDYTYEFGMVVPIAEGQEDANNARAIVLLINKDTKEIVNAEITDILLDGEATGIEEVNRPSVAADRCFDLQGRQLSNSQLANSQMKKGIYIVNGKKVIRK
ncbi:MAG: hypothetical protein II949_09175 [Prevotella sp.]|nr:hypothetical protein [Prevotella sp.]